jgi:hypothetical protein
LNELTCPIVTANLTQAAPLSVEVTAIPAAVSPDNFAASRVRVRYVTVPLFPLPFLTGQLTITRDVVMRVREVA